MIFWVVSGHNGTIDGQGKMWWELWWNRTLEHTRGHLLEIINSSNILISNLAFRNSPFWTIHPCLLQVYIPCLSPLRSCSSLPVCISIQDNANL
ncbi:hypothetical protein TB2_018942 [Malus domestica]